MRKSGVCTNNGHVGIKAEGGERKMKSANEKKMEAYNQMCVRLGLQSSSEYEAFCGVVSGYDVVVSVPDRRLQL